MSDIKRADVLKVTDAVRGGFPDAAICYSFGGCFGMYSILKAVFPGAEPHLDNGNHVVTKIDGCFYDVYGERLTYDGERVTGFTKMTPLQVEKWAVVASSQRVEVMIKKAIE